MGPDFSIIRSICRGQGMTLKELAKKVGISEHGLQRIIRHNTTKTETLLKICRVLDYPPDLFLGYNKQHKASAKVSLLRDCWSSAWASGRKHDDIDTTQKAFQYFLDKNNIEWRRKGSVLNPNLTHTLFNQKA